MNKSMNIAEKLVTALPLETLWTDKRLLSTKRTSCLTSDDIVQLLRKSAVQFVIADVGCKLKWIDSNQSFDFWKMEVKHHIADSPEKIDLESFADSYAYVASLWTAQGEKPIVTLEMLH